MSETPHELSDIHRATLEDFDELQSLLNQANEYSVTQSGFPIWTAMSHVYDSFREQIESGECFVARDPAGAISATICLSELKGGVWGVTGHDGRALYFTKFVKDPARTQPGQARVLLSFAAAEALRRHKPLLRCDTVAEVSGLIDYYIRVGFVRKGEFIYESTGRPGVLLEAPAAALLDKQEF